MTAKRSVFIAILMLAAIALITIGIRQHQRQPITQFYAALPMDDVPFIKSTYPTMLKQIDLGNKNARIDYAHFAVVSRMTQAQSEFLVHDMVAMIQKGELDTSHMDLAFALLGDIGSPRAREYLLQYASDRNHAP